ncbi:MAG TPA: ABC transporter permease [Firmicutes bacterium]|jgi:putative ABC transport system permease protein|nr:ABC transporter permease [Bacillota bacterium]
MSTLFLALRNLFRNKRRTMLTLTAITTGIMALVLFDGFVRYTLWGLQESTIRNGLGHLQLSTAEEYFTTGNFDPFSYLFTDPDEITKKLKVLPEVKEVVPQVTFSATLAGADKSGIVMVQAVPAELSRSLLSFRNIIDGRDFTAADRYRVILAKGVAEKIGARVGDTLTMMAVTRNGGLNAADMEVAGIASLGLRELDNIQVYLDLPTAMDFLDITSVPLLITVLEKTEYTGEVQKTITQRLKPKLGQPLVVKTWEELADYYRQVQEFYRSLLQIVRLIIMLVVIFTIVNTMTMAVLERTREIGTLRAIGTQKTGIMELFLAEGLWIGFFGGIFGVLMGLAGSSFINTALGGIYIPPPPGMAEGYQAFFVPAFATVWQNLLLAVTISVLASIYPALKGVKLKIAEALRYI